MAKVSVKKIEICAEDCFKDCCEDCFEDCFDYCFEDGFKDCLEDCFKVVVKIFESGARAQSRGRALVGSALKPGGFVMPGVVVAIGCIIYGWML